MERIFSEQSIARHDNAGGWFKRYYGWLGSDANRRRYFRSMRNLLRDTDLRGKSVLDLGCGFGTSCLVMSLMGAAAVHGVDIDLGMIETCQSFLSELEPGVDIRLHEATADALPFADGSFDVVICIEALSHINKPMAALDEAIRVLRPGGSIVIADDNNGANRRVRKKACEIWNAFENGPPTDDVHGHRVQVPYRQVRAEMIARRCPELTVQAVQQLALATAYCDQKQIEAALERYLDCGELPGSSYSYGTCPIEPSSGQFIENLLHPFELRQAMGRRGVEVELEAYFGGESRGGMVRAGNLLLNRLLPTGLLLGLSPGFRVRGVKRV